MALKSAFQIQNSQQPKQGPRGLPVSFIFTGASAIKFDLDLEQGQNAIDFVQSVYIDNFANGTAFDLAFDGLGYSIHVKANQQGMYPVVTGPGAVRGTATQAGAGTVKVIFINVEISPATWAV